MNAKKEKRLDLLLLYFFTGNFTFKNARNNRYKLLFATQIWEMKEFD